MRSYKMKHLPALLACALSFGVAIPSIAGAQSVQQQLERRQDKKNEWRNIGTAAAALGVWGLLKNDSTLVFAGATGALYSAWRYEQDRKSHSKLRRTRAQLFSQRTFVRNGVRYHRRSKTIAGKRYYYFVKGRRV